MTDQPFPWQPFRPGTDLILEAVAYSYQVTVDDITGPDRSHLVLRPRTAAAWLMRDLLTMPYPKIGAALNRDHSAAMNLVKRAGREVTRDRSFQQELDTMSLGIRQVATLAPGHPALNPDQQRLQVNP